MLGMGHQNRPESTGSSRPLPVFEMSASRTPAMARLVTTMLTRHPEWAVVQRGADSPPLTAVLEDASDLSVAGVPPREQRIASSALTAFYKRRALDAGEAYLVRVVP